MVIRGKIRGNGSQLANYLLKKADNDNVQVLEIAGTSQPNNLKNALLEMSLTSELTRTDSGLYHAQICPAYNEDKEMGYEDWIRAAEIMEEELGFQGQKRVIVLHYKKLKAHIHIIWERYDHDRGIMKSNKHSRLAQDKARIKMELEFEHKRTPERNAHRPEMKQELSLLWQESENATEFLLKVEKKGYLIGAGTQRPYMVIDESGRSFDLVRQLHGVKTREVRERFKTTKLLKEKQAIELIRQKQRQQKITAEPVQKEKPEAQNRDDLNTAFKENITTALPANDNIRQQKTYSMQVSFTIPGDETTKSNNRLKEVVQKIDDTERQKRELKEKLMRERIERAKRFRDNERDL